jgi:hypothetical protein
VTTLIGHPRKLKNGSWSAIVNGSPEPNDPLTVRTKAGKEWEASVPAPFIYVAGLSDHASNYQRIEVGEPQNSSTKIRFYRITIEEIDG